MSVVCLSCVVSEYVKDNCVVRFKVCPFDFVKGLRKRECLLWLNVVILFVVVVLTNEFVDLCRSNVFKVAVVVEKQRGKELLLSL